MVTDRVPALFAMIGPCALLGAYIGPTLSLTQEMVDPRIHTFAAAMRLLGLNLLGAGLGPLAVGVLSDALTEQAGPRSLHLAPRAIPVLLLGSAVFYWRAARAVSAERESIRHRSRRRRLPREMRARPQEDHVTLA